MANIDAVELGKWERGETERGKVRQFFIGAWYNYTPKVFGWTLSPVRLFFGTLRGLSLLVVSLSPTWLKLYEASRVSREGEAGRAELLSWEQAIAYSAVIASLLLYNNIYI